MDVLTPEQRSRCMSAIKNKHTKPEILVRSLVRKLGYRYRLHPEELAGKPDIVLPSRGLAIFVHGCFWHIHRCRYGKVVPATRAEFWKKKRLGNVQRDRRNRRALRRTGWRVFTVWECWTKNPDKLLQRLCTMLLEP
jgi:DNA mismatch endonuclease (patch repair protein)